MQYSAAVLGATGNVGGQIVRLLVESRLCRRVVVVTRRKTGAFTGAVVHEVVVNMDRLEADVAPHLDGVDIALAAFGVGKGSATMAEADVRRLEVGYPHAFCRAAKAAGARVCGLMTAAGANPASRVKYARILGEKEQAAESVGFDFLGLYRPSVILGNSNTPAYLDRVMPVLDRVLPSRYRSIHKNNLARAMVAQSEQAWQGLTQAGAPATKTVRTLEFAQMQPFFVAGDADA